MRRRVLGRGRDLTGLNPLNQSSELGLFPLGCLRVLFWFFDSHRYLPSVRPRGLVPIRPPSLSRRRSGTGIDLTNININPMLL